MKKFLFLCIAASIAFAASAQNQPAPMLKERAMIKMDAGNTNVTVPLKPVTLTDSKILERIPFGSSFNMLTLTATEENNCVYDADLDYLMFTHRAGGTYGGSSGDIRCHFTPYLGATVIDSVEYIHQGNNLMRYPSGVIYNPAGNTDPANAFSIITGPCTNGSGWVNNFFCSQKLDGSSIKWHFEALNDSFRPAYVNLTACDGGAIKIAGIQSAPNGPAYFRKAQVVADSVDWNSPIHYFTNTYHPRLFSNDTTDWAFAPYQAFSADGMTGYFYVMGWEASDPGLTSGPKPIVWKTTDGGTNWNKQPLLDLSTLDTTLTNWIKPIVTTITGDPSGYIFRPGIMAGSTVEETNYPGIVDADGNLHIAVHIEGMYSNNPDSLEYTYAANPWNIFDLYTTSTGWAIRHVDTIHAGIDEGIILSDQNLDHSFHVARSADGTKIFFMWTDTELDATNYMPDIFARGYDLTNGHSTAPKKMTAESDYYLMNASQLVAESGNSYFLPATFAVINGSTIDAEPTHNFIKGLEFTEAEFDPSYGVNENTIAINDVTVNPNPAIDFINVKFTIDKASSVQISIFNILGKEVYTKSYAKVTAGESKVNINTSDLNSGIYFVTVQAGSQKVTKKIVVE